MPTGEACPVHGESEKNRKMKEPIMGILILINVISMLAIYVYYIYIHYLYIYICRDMIYR